MTSSGTRVRGKTAVYGVVGYPVKHSLSPAMHNSAFRHLGIAAEYRSFEVKPEDLPAFLKRLDKLRIAGLNLTVPHKEIAFKCLRNLSSEASSTGTVNTLTNRSGTLYGDSTDAYGLLSSLKEEFKLRSLKGKTVLLLGAGGAASAVAKQLASSGIKALYIANRTLEKAARLAQKTEIATETKCVNLPLDSRPVSLIMSDVDILINATSAGLKKRDRSPLPYSALKKGLLVYDMIYNSPLTPLLKEAAKAGAVGANGLGMLLHQGAKSFNIWTGKKPPLNVMRSALKKAAANACK